MSRAASPLLLAVVVVACALLAIAIGAGGANHFIFEQVNGLADRLLPESVLEGATILGDGLCAVMLLAPALRRRPQLLAAGLLAAPVAGLLSQLPKHLIHELRPAAVVDAAALHVHGIRLAGANSFPSGHSITAFTIVAVLVLGSPIVRRRPALGALVILGGLLVAASRIAVGAHWPVDVLAGAVLGSFAGALGVHWARRWRFWNSAVGWYVLAALVAGVALALINVDTGYPAARALQYALAALGLAVVLWSIGRRLTEPRPGGEQPAASRAP